MYTQEELDSLVRSTVRVAAMTAAQAGSTNYLDTDSMYATHIEETLPYPEDLSQPVEANPPGYVPPVRDSVRTETARFSSALWFEKISEQTLIVGGQGGISSWFTFLAAKMFPRSIFTYDFDRVERVNLAGQLFSTRDIGLYKGDAVARTISDFCGYRSVYAVTEAFTEAMAPAKIMVCGFDNMDARRVFYRSWKGLVRSLTEEEQKTCLFIDGRLAAESMQILCITGDARWDMEKYESEYLFEDSEADETQCSYKQTAFMANIIAGVMANMLVNHCANLCGGCRTIPFYTQYEADQMYLKLEGGV